MKQEITLCNHRCKKGTLMFEKYATPAIFIMWLVVVGMIWSMVFNC